MHNSKIVFLLNDDTRAIKVQYEEHGTSAVFKTMDPDIKVDDFVVVESGTRWGMTTAKVTEVDVDVDMESHTEIKWALHQINVDAHEELLKQEAAAISAVAQAEKRRKKEELRATMFKDHEESIKALAIANHTEEVTEK